MISHSDVGLDEQSAALSAVLHSKEFVRSPALCKLLAYLCEKTFQGKVHEIKEFSIATEVYGKDQHYGEKRDSLVRVEVSRLRRRLQTYYEGEGAGHLVRILIKSGTYRPEFERVVALPELSEPAAPGIESVPSKPVLPALPAPPRWMSYAALAALLLIAIWFIASRAASKTTSTSTPSRTVMPVAPPLTSQAPQAVRILAGSSVERSVDRFGVEWLGDRYFTGGDQSQWSFGGKEMAVPHPIVRGAPDQLQFRGFRSGSFSYRIPLVKGKYELRLYLSEVILRPTDFGDGVENRRLYDVLMNGKPLLSSFDVGADAGGADTADIRVFENVSPVDGFLTLEFKSLREPAWLNAIEVIPNDTGRALPIRIVARNANSTDHNGQLWGIDRYYVGGRQASDGEFVSGTEDPELFRWQRYGNFSYRFPVPAGKYKLRLLFAETFFGPHNRGKGGAGSRTFNVYCSGVKILKNFDISREAGENRALEKVFYGISPSSQGRIDVAFEPGSQYAVVQGIELTAEDTP